MFFKGFFISGPRPGTSHLLGRVQAEILGTGWVSGGAKRNFCCDGEMFHFCPFAHLCPFVEWITRALSIVGWPIFWSVRCFKDLRAKALGEILDVLHSKWRTFDSNDSQVSPPLSDMKVFLAPHATGHRAHTQRAPESTHRE